MSARFAAAVIFALFGVPATAQCVGTSYFDTLSTAEQATLANAASQTSFGTGILWDATKGDQTATVVGTMHVFDPRLETLRNAVTEDVANADVILLEATQEEQDALQRLIVEQPDVLFITEGPTLPDLLDEPTWELIADAARARSIPPFMAAKMQPWYLSLLMAIPSCAMAAMLDGKLGLDHMIMEDAAAAGVPTLAIEDVMSLFDIFQDDTLEAQIDLLRINLLAPDIQQQMFVAMLDAYFAEDVGTLWEMSRFAMANTPGIDPEDAATAFAEFEQGLLISRNLAWRPKLADAVAQHDDIVVAVGAAHLMGESGVLQFFVDEGWAVERRVWSQASP